MFSILKWDFMLYQSITFNGKAPFSIYIFKLPTVYLTNLFFISGQRILWEVPAAHSGIHLIITPSLLTLTIYCCYYTYIYCFQIVKYLEHRVKAYLHFASERDGVSINPGNYRSCEKSGSCLTRRRTAVWASRNSSLPCTSSFSGEMSLLFTLGCYSSVLFLD